MSKEYTTKTGEVMTQEKLEQLRGQRIWTADDHRRAEGVEKLFGADFEIHPKGGHEYAALYIMRKGNERRIAFYHDSFFSRIPKFSRLMWAEVGMQEETPRQIARMLLDQGWFPSEAEKLLDDIAGYVSE